MTCARCSGRGCFACDELGFITKQRAHAVQLPEIPSRDRMVRAARTNETLNGFQFHTWRTFPGSNRTEVEAQSPEYDMHAAWVGNNLVSCHYEPRNTQLTGRKFDMTDAPCTIDLDAFALGGVFNVPPSLIVDPICRMPDDDTLYGKPTRDDTGQPIKHAASPPAGRITYAVDDFAAIARAMKQDAATPAPTPVTDLEVLWPLSYPPLAADVDSPDFDWSKVPVFVFLNGIQLEQVQAYNIGQQWVEVFDAHGRAQRRTMFGKIQVAYHGQIPRP